MEPRQFIFHWHVDRPARAKVEVATPIGRVAQEIRDTAEASWKRIQRSCIDEFVLRK